jgi:hypothetical protein
MRLSKDSRGSGPIDIVRRKEAKQAGILDKFVDYISLCFFLVRSPDKDLAGELFHLTKTPFF